MRVRLVLLLRLRIQIMFCRRVQGCPILCRDKLASIHVRTIRSVSCYCFLLSSCFIDSLRTGWMNSGSRSFNGSRTKKRSLILGCGSVNPCFLMISLL